MHFNVILGAALVLGAPVMAALKKSRQSSSSVKSMQCFHHMCVTATVNGSNVDYVLSSTGQANVGYMAVGFGSQMSNTPMVILWSNSDGSITLSQRLASGHQMPQVQSDPPVKATLEPDLSVVSSTSTPSYGFSIPSDSATTVDLIYAFSDSTPSSSSVDANIRKHLSMGTTTLDLSSSSGTTSSTSQGASGGSSLDQPLSRTEKYIVAHAILSVAGFLFLLPVGALLARYFRTFTNYWFTSHLAVQFYLAGPVIMVGFALGVASVSMSGGEPLDDDHKKWGVAIFSLYMAQIFLGFFIHRFKSTNGKRPLQNYVHVVFGLSIIGLAYYQVRLGYREEWTKITGRKLPEIVDIVWYIWVVAIPVLYLAGLTFLFKQFRQEREQKTNTKAPIKSLKLRLIESPTDNGKRHSGGQGSL